MENLQGIAVSDGVAIGKIKYYKPHRSVGENTCTDKATFFEAKKEALSQLGILAGSALERFGQESADIIDSQKMILEDEEFDKAVIRFMEDKGLCVTDAIREAAEYFEELFLSMNDDVLRGRAMDVRDVSGRLIDILSGNDTDVSTMEPFGEKVIIVADELTPSDTLRLDKDDVLALVTRGGSTNSHTAILSRAMGIPAIVQVDGLGGIFDEINGGDSVSDTVDMIKTIGIVDGYTGKLIINPSEEVIDIYTAKMEEDMDKKAKRSNLLSERARTKSGRSIELLANINSMDELEDVINSGADGIGLFRSEFLLLGSSKCPSEDEQYEIYKKTLIKMGGKKVIVRTFDIGADKQVPYLNLDSEDNPALGLRGIRLALKKQDLLKTQLRALYRASSYGSLSIMYPMITSSDEVTRLKEISKLVREELVSEGVDIGIVEEGIMIETPAAAIVSDELAGMVSFFSIGTNDLSQYTLAIDRQNAKVSEFFDAYHPAIFRLIEMTIASAHKHGIKAGICGELGADTRLTEQFLDMGVDELSVAPGQVLSVKEAIISAK